MNDDADCDAAAALPCAQALVAATFALMTAHAAPCPQSTLPADAQRRLLARKVVSNLFFLMHHPALSAPMRQVIANAHARWVEVAGTAAAPAPPPGPGPAVRRDLH